MANKISTYLAGPIDGKNMQSAKDWRNNIEIELSKLNIYGMNPLGNNGGDRISGELRQKLHNAVTLGDIDTIRKIVGNIIISPDLKMLEECDFLTLWLPKRINPELDLYHLNDLSSYDLIEYYILNHIYEVCGTYGEVTLAYYLKKPIYIVTERRICPCELPSWVVGCSTEVFTSWKSYLKYVEKKWVNQEDPISKVLRTTSLSAEELFR